MLRQVEMLKTLGARTTRSIGMEFDGTDALPPPDAPLTLGVEAAG